MSSAAVLGTNLVVATGALLWVLATYGRPALALLAREIDLVCLAGVVACIALALGGFAWRWQRLLARLGIIWPLRALVAVRAAGQSVSALIPSARLGGEPLRMYLLVRDGVGVAPAMASVTVDRVLEMGAGMPFALVYAGLLVQRGVPALEGALISVVIGALAFVVGIAVTVRRLRTGRGVVTAVARATGLQRLPVVGARMEVLDEAETEGRRLLAGPGSVAFALAIGLAVHVVVMVEYHLLLRTFGLPTGWLPVVAAIFGTGAAHSLPVPAAVGVLEGAQMWLFGTLGYPPEVGLAVGLAVRVRELLWVLPGLLVLAARGIVRPVQAMATDAMRG